MLLRVQALVCDVERAARIGRFVGKLSIPSEILDKPGPLDEREWEFIRHQTLIGERIIRTSPQLWGVAAIVRATHENWDGTGYPDGLVGEEIPLASRTICACDAYYAMTSDRPYRPALSVDEALNELMRLAGTQFDPTVVRVLVAHVRDELQAEHAA